MSNYNRYDPPSCAPDMPIPGVPIKSVREYESVYRFPSVGIKDFLYLSRENNAIYRWDMMEGRYVPVSGFGDAESVYVMDDIIVEQQVGGLEAGYNMKDKSVFEILEKLVGADIPPIFTPSSVTVAYNAINTRTSTDSDYKAGDTVKLNSVTFTLTKGTDFSGFVSGVIINGSTTNYTLTQQELDTLSNSGSVTINLANCIYEFPISSSVQTHKFKCDLVYGKKSYGESGQVVIVETHFDMPEKTITAAGATDVFYKLYIGAIPENAELISIGTDAKFYYEGGNTTGAKYQELGTKTITTTDEATQAIIACQDRLNDIKFMGISTMNEWDMEERTFTTETDTKLFYVYSSVLATGSFLYDIS